MADPTDQHDVGCPVATRAAAHAMDVIRPGEAVTCIPLAPRESDDNGDACMVAAAAAVAGAAKEDGGKVVGVAVAGFQVDVGMKASDYAAAVMIPGGAAGQEGASMGSRVGGGQGGAMQVAGAHAAGANAVGSAGGGCVVPQPQRTTHEAPHQPQQHEKGEKEAMMGISQRRGGCGGEETQVCVPEISAIAVAAAVTGSAGGRHVPPVRSSTMHRETAAATAVAVGAAAAAVVTAAGGDGEPPLKRAATSLQQASELHSLCL